ncbi:nucleotidyltransferase [Candidatus Poribacteria bacterium]|nr:nucleotidyltransferase [Candidatus Poribacteria bacterium]MYA54974.1 nucleotidyltransferase [Candidatus Poribacteria bacterium]
MELPTYFTKFLQGIRPTKNQKDDCQTGHQTLRKRLENYEDLKQILVSTFLQGSYRRATAVRPKGEAKLDVDIITVTRLKRENYPNPDDAMDIFVPFLDEYYEGKYQRQGRSFGIELSYVNLDLVITSAPSEAEEEAYKSQAARTFLTPEDIDDWFLKKSWVPPEKRSSQTAFFEAIRQEQEWKTEPLWIPNRDAGDWEETHPLEQIKWTWGKNARCNKHYVNIVKPIKWWQRVHHPDDRPKGYPLEHLIGVCCPDDITSVAEGVTLTLENIVANYGAYAECELVPYLPDHGVPGHNVLDRVSGEEFAEFYEHAETAAEIAREALDAETKEKSIEKWRELFGNKFPDSDDSDDNGNSGNSSKGPFVAPLREQTGDLTPRKYG